MDDLQGQVRNEGGHAGKVPQRRTSGARHGREHLGDVDLGPDRVGAKDDRGSQQVQGGLRLPGGFLFKQVLQVRLLLGVEEPVRRSGCPVLTHADRVVTKEAVCRHRRRVHESLGPDVGRRTERVQGAFDVDRLRGLPAAAEDQEGQVHDHVGPLEGRPVARRRREHHRGGTPSWSSHAPGIEGPPSDADDAIDPTVLLEQGHQRQPEGPGGPGHRHCEPASIRHRPTLVAHTTHELPCRATMPRTGLEVAGTVQPSSRRFSIDATGSVRPGRFTSRSPATVRWSRPRPNAA